ncbi:hypothetical protein ACVW1C_002543 [Bradyrhizobium sp. USDA 4011]
MAICFEIVEPDCFAMEVRPFASRRATEPVGSIDRYAALYAAWTDSRNFLT